MGVELADNHPEFSSYFKLGAEFIQRREDGPHKQQVNNDEVSKPNSKSQIKSSIGGIDWAMGLKGRKEAQWTISEGWTYGGPWFNRWSANKARHQGLPDSSNIEVSSCTKLCS